MAYNFKSIADVEVVVEPTESANVLIEENGVIKKAPKTAVGGAGGEADMVIALTMRFNFGVPTADNTTITIESGSLEAVVEALRDGRPPVVKCKRYYLTNGFDMTFPIAEGGVYDCNVFYYGGDIHFSFFVPSSEQFGVQISMNIDDPDFLEVWYYPLMFTTVQVI